MSAERLPLLVSEVQIFPVKPRDGLVAFASCVINGQLYLGNIGVHTRRDGSEFRLLYPVKMLPNGKELQCFHPITRETGEILRRAITIKLQAMANEGRQEREE